MKRAIGILLALGIGLTAMAGTMAGLGGYIVPGLTYEEEPVFSFIPQYVMGWGNNPLITAGFGFIDVYYPEDGWAKEVSFEVRIAALFDFVQYLNFRAYMAPVVALSSKFIAADTGEAELELIPNWGLRLGAHGILWNNFYGSVYVDFQPGMGFVPGFTFGLWLDPLGSE